MKARKGFNFLQPFFAFFFFCKYQIRGQSAAFGNSHLRRGEWKKHKAGMSSFSFFCCHSTERLQKESRGHRCSNRRHTSKLLPRPPFEFEKSATSRFAHPHPHLDPPKQGHIPSSGNTGEKRTRTDPCEESQIHRRRDSRGEGGVQCELAWGSGGLGGSCHVAVIPGRGFQSCFLCAFSGTV